MSDRCTANDNFCVDVFFFYFGYDLFHIFHCCCQQSRKANYSIRFFCYGFQEFLTADVNPQINNLPTAAFDHHGNQVFTNIMEISFYCSNNECSLPELPGLSGKRALR